MEKKTKHRILGVLVLAGLVVIVLPFLQTSNELPSQTVLVNAPPFPDEAAANPTDASLNKEIAANTSEPIPLSVTTVPLITPAPEQTTASVDNAESTQVEKVEAKQVSVEELPAGSVKDTSAGPKLVQKKATSHQVKTVKMAAAHKAKVAKVVKKLRKRTVGGYQVLDPADLAATSHSAATLKNKAWVVQVGSFKSKTNALKLVNALRTRGYRSFIEQASANKHGLTKVMVGPERKIASAHTLASRIEKDVHVRGVVVHYKPFKL